MKSFLSILIFAAASLCLHAQQFDNPVAIPVSYYGYGVCNYTQPGAYCAFSFGAGSGAYSSVSVQNPTPGSQIYSAAQLGNLMPGVNYTVTVTSSNMSFVTVVFNEVDGCQVYINGNRGNSYSSGTNYSFTLRLERTNDISQSLAGRRGGACTSFPVDKPIWLIGLGATRNGRLAGALGFRANSITSALYNTSSLICGVTDPGEVSITRDANGYITQVQSRDVVLNVSPYNSAGTSYTIKACRPATPSTAFITYTISQYVDANGSNGIRIDKVEAAGTNSTGDSWTTVLQQTSTGWRKYDWQRTNSFASTNDVVVTTVSGSTSTINYGSAGGANTLTQQKTYTTVGGQTELASSKWGNENPTTYTYYSNSGGGGWADAVNTVTSPSGGWVAYDYYNSPNDTSAGQIYHVYRPWLNSPSAPSGGALGYVETYTYAANYDGSNTAPASKLVTINGTTAGNTTWTYNWAYETANSHEIAQTVETDYSASGAGLTTTTLSFLPNDATGFFQKAPYSVTHADGTKVSYAYYFGTWNAGTETFSPGSSGNDRYVLAFHGQDAAQLGGSSSAGSQVSSWTVGGTSWALDSIYLVPDLSTVDEQVIDTNGHVVFSGQEIYNGSALERISGVANTYNENNQLVNAKDVIRSVSGGDVSVGYSYTGGKRTGQVAVDGTSTTWALDNYLRVLSVTTTSGNTTNYPTVVQNYQYYSSNLKYTAQETEGSPTITTYAYDSAGRPLTVSTPNPNGGNLTTSYTYNSGLETTIALPDGATKITDLYLDGKVADQLGSAQVPTYYEYSVNSNGAVVKTARHDSAKAHGWVEDTTDWLGRKLLERTPEWNYTANSAAILSKVYGYDSATGQLSSLAVQDGANGSALVLPTHYYVYGNMGMMIEDGDDVGGNGQLDVSSTDRIKLYSTQYYKETSGFMGWIREDLVQGFDVLNTSHTVDLSMKLTRMTNFNGGALYNGTARVLSDVSTVDTSGITKTDLTYSDFSAETTTHRYTISATTGYGESVAQNSHLISDRSLSGVQKTYDYNSLGQLSKVVEQGSGANTAITYFSGTDFEQTATTTSGPTTTTALSYGYSWNASAATYTKSVTDAANNISYTEYNSLGLPIHTWGTSAQPVETGYDGYGNRTSLTTWQSGSFSGSTWPSSPSGGNTVQWAIDGSTGLVNTKTFPDNHTINYTYNARGQLKTKVSGRNITTTYSYFDSSGSLTGELKGVTYSDSTPALGYTYTRVGSIATVSDAAGTRMISYRSDLQASSEALPAFFGNQTLTYSYDSSSRLTGFSYGSGASVTAATTFDPATGRVNGTSGALDGASVSFTIGYASGTDWVNSVTSGSYSRSTPLLASTDWISSVTTSMGSSTLGSFSAQYADSRGWRDGQGVGSSLYSSALGIGSESISYGYDSYGQITSTSGAVASGWTYDLAGNRKTETGTYPTTYTPNSVNQYLSITGTLAEGTLVYDADGNLTQDGTWNYSYDAENRLIQMSRSGQTLTFVYDYRGRRIRKTVTGTGASDTKYLWVGWRLVAELASDGTTPQKSYVWGVDMSDGHGNAGNAGGLLAQIDASGSVYYGVPDVLGNIVAYVNSSGTIVAATQYSPYGRALLSAGTVADFAIGFSSQYTDAESGLVYYGYRYYNPKHGRFINRDPSGEAGGVNLYGFVGNGPTQGWDLLGLQPTLPANATPAEAADYTQKLETWWEQTHFGMYTPSGTGELAAISIQQSNVWVTAISHGFDFNLTLDAFGVDQTDSFHDTGVDNPLEGQSRVELVGRTPVVMTWHNNGTYGAAWYNDSLNHSWGQNWGDAPNGVVANASSSANGFVIINSPVSGQKVSIDGYGVLQIVSYKNLVSYVPVPGAPNGVSSAMLKMVFTPTDGEPAQNFDWIQWRVLDPYVVRVNPHNKEPILDSWITRHGQVIPSGYYTDNFSQSGRYNNGQLEYSNGSLYFFDNPQNFLDPTRSPQGDPVNFVTFLVNKKTGVFLGQINWTLPAVSSGGPND